MLGAYSSDKWKFERKKKACVNADTPAVQEGFTTQGANQGMINLVLYQWLFLQKNMFGPSYKAWEDETLIFMQAQRLIAVDNSKSQLFNSSVSWFDTFWIYFIASTWQRAKHCEWMTLYRLKSRLIRFGPARGCSRMRLLIFSCYDDSRWSDKFITYQGNHSVLVLPLVVSDYWIFLSSTCSGLLDFFFSGFKLSPSSKAFCLLWALPKKER